MKKIEIIQPIKLPGLKFCSIVTKYPWWMKWFMKSVECYIIPDVRDYKIVQNKSKFHAIYKDLIIVPPKFKYNIGDIA